MKNKIISGICLVFFVLGLVMTFFCDQAWLKIIGMVILAVTIILGIDFFADEI